MIRAHMGTAPNKLVQLSVKLTSKDINDLENTGVAHGTLEKHYRNRTSIISASAIREGAYHMMNECCIWKIIVREEYFDLLKTGMEVKFKDPHNKKLSFRFVRVDD